MEKRKELFVKAFLEAEAIDNSKVINEEDLEWVFSENFEKSMNKLIQKNRKIKLSTRRNIRRGVLAAIIAIIVLLTGVLSISATRTPFIEFVKRIFPQFNEISLSDDSNLPVNKIEEEYTLGWLPDGYTLVTYQRDDYSVFEVWNNDSGDEIAFSQRLLDSSFTIDNENYYKELEINGYKAFYVEDEYGAVIKWTDGYYWFTITVPKRNIKDIMTIQEKISVKN